MTLEVRQQRHTQQLVDRQSDGDGADDQHEGELADQRQRSAQVEDRTDNQGRGTQRSGQREEGTHRNRRLDYTPPVPENLAMSRLTVSGRL